MGRGGAGRGREGLGGRKVEGEAVATSSLRTSGEGGDGTLPGGGGDPPRGACRGGGNCGRGQGSGRRGASMGRGVNKGPGWARPRGIKAAEVGSGAASQRVERGRSWGRGEAEGVEGQGGLGACGCRKDRTPRERCWEDGGGGGRGRGELDWRRLGEGRCFQSVKIGSGSGRALRENWGGKGEREEGLGKWGESVAETEVMCAK